MSEQGQSQKQWFRDQGVEYVAFMSTRADGSLKSMEEFIDNVPGVIDYGLTIDGSSLGYVPVDASDVSFVPDLESRTILSDEGLLTGAYMSFVRLATGEMCPTDPRCILQRQIDRAAEMGFKLKMFSELEFFLRNEDGSPQDLGGYMDMAPLDGGVRFRRELVDQFTASGVHVKRAHHEVAQGQNEVELGLTPPMKNADDTVIGMWLTKRLAHKYGWTADFMPKPYQKVNGSGLHMHMMLTDLEGANAFSDPDAHYLMNEKCHQFISGLLKYARDICAVFGRDEQTYQRLQPGYEAPVYAVWGAKNRAALVRLPLTSDPSKVRVEFRAGDATSSPHLLAAAMIAAGLRGIEEKLEPQPEFVGNPERLATSGITQLPTSLVEANAILESSEFCRELLGESCIRVLIDGVDSLHH